MKKFMKVCSTCGSDDVSAEVSAVRWDFDEQEWYISGDVCDKGHYCGSCDGECRIEDKEVP